MIKKESEHLGHLVMKLESIFLNLDEAARQVKSAINVARELRVESVLSEESDRKIGQILMNESMGALSKDEKKILEFIRSRMEAVPRRILSIRYHNTLGSPRIDQTLRTLVERGLIQEDVTSTKGRPLTTYSIRA